MVIERLDEAGTKPTTDGRRCGGNQGGTGRAAGLAPVGAATAAARAATADGPERQARRKDPKPARTDGPPAGTTSEPATNAALRRPASLPSRAARAAGPSASGCPQPVARGSAARVRSPDTEEDACG